MAFDFPSSPSEGQIFNAPGGPSYVFNTPVWKAVGQGQIAIISDTPPPSPANGALWYESDSGVLYIWYNDGNSSQWVQVGGMAPPIMLAFVQRQFITVSGAITLHADTKAFQVEVQGGGGGTGACANSAANQSTAAAGAGAGGYCSKWIIRPAGTFNPVATIAAAAGAGGTGNASSYSDGTNTLTANGGTASSGAGSAAWITYNGGSGGSATGGDINIKGENGGYSYTYTTGTTVSTRCGQGGSSRFGSSPVSGGNTAAAGQAGYVGGVGAFGSGSTGGFTYNGWGALGAVIGSPGCIVITEYR